MSPVGHHNLCPDTQNTVTQITFLPIPAPPPTTPNPPCILPVFFVIYYDQSCLMLFSDPGFPRLWFLFWSVKFVIFSINSSNASHVDVFFLKPYWLSESNLLQFDDYDVMHYVSGPVDLKHLFISPFWSFLKFVLNSDNFISRSVCIMLGEKANKTKNDSSPQSSWKLYKCSLFEKITPGKVSSPEALLDPLNLSFSWPRDIPASFLVFKWLMNQTKTCCRSDLHSLAFTRRQIFFIVCRKG